MTIQERLKRSNLIMLIVPVVIAGGLLALGLVALVLLLQNIYLPQLGLTLRDLHDMGEQAENLLSGLKLFIVLYAVVVLVALLATVIFTNLYLTRALFVHIKEPMDELMRGVRRIQDGDLDSPIAYSQPDEFRPVCDAVDEMAARLKESLAAQQKEQQKKQELIAGMSHDLKSPLTIIRAYTEALLEGIARDEAARQRYLQTIYAKETDLEALINRLFELAKLGASEYPVHLRTLSLQEALQKILREGEYEGLLIRCDAISDVRVTADYELLNRIFHNLADNSCKYGASTLTFSFREEHGTVILTAKDNGPGVAEDKLPQLFEPFYRGDAARTKPGSGSGLGLAVVQKSMQQMGGDARAENVPGGGLCIILTLQPAEK